MHVFYLDPGFPLSSIDLNQVPNQINLIKDSLPPNSDRAMTVKDGVNVISISDSIVAKYGSNVSFNEASNMIFVSRNTSIPIPRLYACFAYGPIRDSPYTINGTSEYDVYLLMERINGVNLQSCQDSLDDMSWQNIANEVTSCIRTLRSLPPPSLPVYIGSSYNSPISHPLFGYTTNAKGKFLETPYSVVSIHKDGCVLTIN